MDNSIERQSSQSRPRQQLLDQTTNSKGKLEPMFDDVSTNITAVVGKNAYLTCHVRNLGNKSVSFNIHKVYCILIPRARHFSPTSQEYSLLKSDNNTRAKFTRKPCKSILIDSSCLASGALQRLFAWKRTMTLHFKLVILPSITIHEEIQIFLSRLRISS